MLQAIWQRILDRVLEWVAAGALALVAWLFRRRVRAWLAPSAGRAWEWLLIRLRMRHVESDEEREAREFREHLLSEDPDQWRQV